jgi:hypothetical protein
MSPLIYLFAGGAAVCLITDLLPRYRRRSIMKTRKELSPNEMHSMFFSDDVNEQDVMLAFDLLGNSLDFPVGLLRPNDRLDSLNVGAIDRDIDYLYDLTAARLADIPLDHISERLAQVQTVGDYVIEFAGLLTGNVSGGGVTSGT